MSEELKVKRSYAIPENEMVIIKDTNTLLHNIVDSELKEKDKEIERLNNIINTMLEFNLFAEECPLNFGYTERCNIVKKYIVISYYEI